MAKKALAFSYADLFEFYHECMEDISDQTKALTHFNAEGNSVVVENCTAKHLLFSINSSGGRFRYKVEFEFEKSSKCFIPTCECPQFDNFNSCKHVGAIAIWFSELFPEGMVIDDLGRPIVTIPKDDGIKKPTTWQVQCKPLEIIPKLNSQRILNRHHRSVILPVERQNDRMNFAVGYGELGRFATRISYLGNDTFELNCLCSKGEACIHFKSLLELYYMSGDINRLIPAHDFSKQKAAIITQLGLLDHMAKSLQFKANLNGEVELADTANIVMETEMMAVAKSLKFFEAEHIAPGTSTLVPAIVTNKYDSKALVPFYWKVAQPIQKKKNVRYEVLESQHMGAAFFEILPDELKPIFSAVTTSQDALSRMQYPIVSEASKNRYTSEFFKLQTMAISFWDLACERNAIVLMSIEPSKLNMSTGVYKPYPGLAQIEVHYQRYEQCGEIGFSLIYENARIPGQQLIEVCRGVYRDSAFVYLVCPKDHVTLSSFRPSASQVVVKKACALLESTVLPMLAKRFLFQGISGAEQDADVQPTPVVHLSSLDEKFILIQLSFRYLELEVEWNTPSTIIFVRDQSGQTFRVMRKLDLETERRKFLISLSPEFERQVNREQIYVSNELAFRNFWMLGFVQQLLHEGFEVHGQEKLKGLTITKNPFQFKLKGKVNNGWFEMSANANFGELTVPVDRIARAMESKEKYVLLDDGTVGQLPEEWMDRFALMFKMSERTSDDQIKLSTTQVMLMPTEEWNVDASFGALIAERQSALTQLSKLKLKPLGSKIKAELRSYQRDGFQWLQQMYHTGFGACLADDMGLGKTLQTICYIDFLLTKEKSGRVLVVCPTSLLFNWDSELKKFAPHIRFITHHGASREVEFDKKCRVILTSYGTLRNDIDAMNREEWLQVILDESQAIKNPLAQMTLALQSLTAKHRLILSGTPIQNNTFDLWSQYQFINPGLLGNKKFFQESFSQAIDKNRDQLASEQLRKLIYPFLLRRTKDQVAKDLPAKTESILWCDMARDQRKLYEEVRQYYHDAISNSIEKNGIGKSSFIVLEGMLKLRQICDAPALIKKAVSSRVSSVKMEELMRELEENTSTHKVLVFSQFTEMLKLIQQRMESNKMKFCYLDGKTTLKNRQQQVEAFQTDKDVRVFLISLKAGGVGLNLTQADYVYLVDPWWNPAAEQQAIDRTHRIGQNKPVIAYKMICKDTIEEKILHLQEHKQGIASDLIKEDASMFKKLNKEDILGLFHV